MRELNDVLIRVLSAWAASQATGTPLVDTLALYRAEGALAAPPSLGSIERGIPSGTSKAPSLINPSPDFSQLVWMVSPAFAAGQTDELIKEKALSQWYVQIGGLDEVGMLRPPRRTPFIDWSSRNWLAAQDIDPAAQSRLGGAATEWQAGRAAAARWDSQMQNLEIRRVHSATATVSVMVLPRSAETLISGVLSEAVMRWRAGGKVASMMGVSAPGGMPTDLAPELAYLAYNTGIDNFKRMLASAAIAASKTHGPRYQPLRDAIAGNLDVAALDPPLNTLETVANLLDKPGLTGVEHLTLGGEMQSVMPAIWTPMSAWLLADANNLALLSEFVETADAAVWKSWKTGKFSPRSNMSRYQVLRAFYQLL